MLVVDAEAGGIVDANVAAKRLFELPDAYDGLNLADCLSFSVEQLQRILVAAAKTGHPDFSDHYAPLKTGHREIQLHGGAVQYGADRRLFLIAHEHAADQMDSPTDSLDPLNGLPNKTLLRDRLQQALARARRSKEHCTVLFLDLDHFEVIIEDHAHSVGNQLLKAFSDWLGGFVRATDTVARFGDDTFFVPVTELQDVAHSATLAQKMLRSLTTPFDIKWRELVRDGQHRHISLP